MQEITRFNTNKPKLTYYLHTDEIQRADRLRNHFKSLLDKHSKIYPVRLDFRYQENTSKTQAQAFSDMFLLYSAVKSIRPTILGFAFAMEYSSTKRLHVHTLFYADGQKHKHFQALLDDIQEVWKKRIKYAQDVYCCHFNKEYKYDALVKFSYGDMDVIKIFDNYILPYFSKNDQKEGLIEPMYQIGVSVVSPPSGRGRPRKA